jgi:hypothetical protein
MGIRSDRYAYSALMRIGIISLSLGGCARTPPPASAEASIAAFVEVREGAELRQDSGGQIIAPATAVYPVARRSAGSRFAAIGGDSTAAKKQWERVIWIQAPNARYAVAREMIRAVSATPQKPRDDAAAIALYQAIEDSIGLRLGELRCDPRHDGPLAAAEENVVADWIALRMLAAAGVEPAAYPTIEKIANASYHRPLNWGRRRCPDPRAGPVVTPASG